MAKSPAAAANITDDPVECRIRIFEGPQESSVEIDLPSFKHHYKSNGKLEDLKRFLTTLQATDIYLVNDSPITNHQLVNTIIESIMLNENVITISDNGDFLAVGIEKLADMLPNNKTLQTLTIRHGDAAFALFDTRGVNLIANALTTNTSLKELTICDSERINVEECAEAINKMLENNTSLKKLIFSNCYGLYDRELYEPLCRNNTLKTIEGDFWLGESKDIAQVLRKNKSLERFDIKLSCGIAHEKNESMDDYQKRMEQYISDICGGLSYNTTITSFNVECDDDLSEALKAKISQKTQLITDRNNLIAKYVHSGLLTREGDCLRINNLDEAIEGFKKAPSENKSLLHFVYPFIPEDQLRELKQRAPKELKDIDDNSLLHLAARDGSEVARGFVQKYITLPQSQAGSHVSNLLRQDTSADKSQSPS